MGESVAEDLEDPGTFIRFPSKSAVLVSLYAIVGDESAFESVFEPLAERLASTAYDRSAFVFILIESIYELEEVIGRNLNHLLSDVVLALTRDVDLAASALSAFREVKETIEPITTEIPPHELPSPAAPAIDAEALDGLEVPPTSETLEVPPTSETDLEALGLEVLDLEVPPTSGTIPPQDQGNPEAELLMIELQKIQKQIMDSGLSTRMSIEMTLGRPSHESVNQTLREISTLRSSLRRFEELLGESEKEILEVIGVLERPSG